MSKVHRTKPQIPPPKDDPKYDTCIACLKHHPAHLRVHFTSMTLECWVLWKKLSVNKRVERARQWDTFVRTAKWTHVA